MGLHPKASISAQIECMPSASLCSALFSLGGCERCWSYSQHASVEIDA